MTRKQLLLLLEVILSVRVMAQVLIPMLEQNLRVQLWKKWALVGQVPMVLERVEILLPVVMKALGHQIQFNGITATLTCYLDMSGNNIQLQLEQSYGMLLTRKKRTKHLMLKMRLSRYPL